MASENLTEWLKQLPDIEEMPLFCLDRECKGIPIKGIFFEYGGQRGDMHILCLYGPDAGSWVYEGNVKNWHRHNPDTCNG